MSDVAAIRRRAAYRRARGGFSLVEVVVGVAVLAVGFLSYLATTISTHRLSEEERTRSTALAAARQMIEALRADEDWAGLWTRLNAQQALAGQTSVQQASTLRLPDGRATFPPSTYYAHLDSSLPSLGVLVEVPAAPAGPGLPDVLREDDADARFGLPADLDCDGTIGAVAVANHHFLPVLLTVRWEERLGVVQTLGVTTWIRGGP